MQSLQIINAKVWHKRTQPKQNEFTYRVFYIAYTLGGLQEHTPRLISFDHFNLLSIYASNHGARDGSDLYAWACNEFQKFNIKKGDGDMIELVTHPRVLGYAFNPISFYFLRNNLFELKAVLCEVSNTFDEHYNYIFAKEDGSPIVSGDVFYAEKELYVSPFNTMHGGYTFSFTRTGNMFKADIVYVHNDEVILRTAVAGTYDTLSSLRIIATLFTHPLMTFMVIFRIHWQALKLFMKGVPETLAIRPDHEKTSTTRGTIRQ